MATVTTINQPITETSAAEAAARIVPAHQAIGPLKMTVFGRNKQGKTHFAGSSGLRTLVVDCNENGIETLRNVPGVDVYQATVWSDIDGIFWHAKNGKHDYQVFVIDTVTTLATMALRHNMGKELSLDPLATKNVDWNRINQVLDNEIIRWRNLPAHVIFVAQERTITVKNNEGDDVVSMIAPSLTPHPLSTLMGAVGTIGRIYVEEVEQDEKTTLEHRMLLGPHPVFTTGTRIRGLPRIARNPTLAKLLARRAQAGEEPVKSSE